MNLGKSKIKSPTGCPSPTRRKEITMPELYIKYRGDTPYQYRYGDESEAIRLLVDAGYDTPEEAFETWMEETNEAM